MTSDQDELARCWEEAANRIAEVLERGDDACFLTLGDPLLYSTYIYLLRALRRRHSGYCSNDCAGNHLLQRRGSSHRISGG